MTEWLSSAGPSPEAAGDGKGDMRVWIDTDQCTGSGLCELIEPRVFLLGDDGLARVQHDGEVLPPGPDNAARVPSDCADRVREASQSCPGGCIRVEES